MAAAVGKRFVGAAVLAAVAAVSIWLQQRTVPMSREIQVGTKVPDYYLNDFVAKTMDENGNLSYQLEARSMVHYAGENVAELSAPELVNHRTDGQVWTINSDTAKAFQQGDMLFLEGNVAIRRKPFDGSGPVEVDTNDLWVYQGKQVAETNAPVEIREDRGITTGEGMLADIKEGRLQLLSKVRGEYVVKRN